MNIASDRMKVRYDAREENLVWFITRKEKFSPKLSASWKGRYNIVKKINDVV